MSRIGIVAIGRNEGERLIRCLKSLDPAARPVVYVDAASTDGSADAARALGALVVDLDMSRPFTAARARDEGFAALIERAPEIELVQFIDGDCEIEAGWLAAAAGFLDAHLDVVVVCGRRRERFPDASLYNRLCDEEWDTPVGEAAACGGDALMRRAAFAGVGGFDAMLTAGEEPELCARLRARGGRVWRLDAPMTIHDAAMHRFRQWWLRGVRSGVGYAQAFAATRRLAPPLYRRDLVRAVIWAGVVPVIGLAAAVLVTPWMLVALALVYAVQIARIARRRGGGSFAWRYAALMMLAKFAELRGALRYVVRRAAPGSAIAYK